MIFRILQDPLAIILVVLFFGASIFVHEYGHYLAARIRKLKIERFSIGFGPRLFGWKDKAGVDWRVSLFPLGGYVALPQLADMRGIEGDPNAEVEELPELSYTDKIIVSGAGAFFNILFALFLGTVLWITGLPVSGETETTTIGYIASELTDSDGMRREGPAKRAGLLPGDRILTIDDSSINDWEDVIYAITVGVRRSEAGNPRLDITVDRDGDELQMELFPVLDEYEGVRRIGIAPANSLRIGHVMDNSPAALAGLQAGDTIISADGVDLYHTVALGRMIQENPDAEFQLEVTNGDGTRDLSLKAEQVAYNKAGDTTPLIGVRWEQILTTRHVNPVTQVLDAVRVTLRVLGALIHPKSDVGINNLSGPVGIGYTLYVISQIGILEVLSIVVLINVNLAILNLLPIPVLDGGHMAFATFAKLRGRPVPPKIVAGAQGTFMILFLAIFVYVTFFDFGRVKRNESAITNSEESAKEMIPIEFKSVDNSDPEKPES